MSVSTRHRRTLVVNRSIVARNVALLKERLGAEGFSVWSGRPSGLRFLGGFRSVAEELDISIVDGELPPETEIRLSQIVGGHPELRCAVSLETHLFGVRTVEAGEGVSYGSLFVAPAAMPVGLAPIGFADGIDRKLSGSMRVRVGNTDVAVLGRIAMDSMSLDLSDVAGAASGALVTVYGDTTGDQWGVRDSARALGIVPVEIITRLSERSEVVWR